MNTTKVVWLPAALLSLSAVALLHQLGGSAPPLYDGLCSPIPYRALGATPGPSSASATFTAAGLAQPEQVLTGEPNPQATLTVAGGSFAPAGGAVTITITAVTPPAVKPPDGVIEGNVYRFAAVAADGRAVDLMPGQPATVTLADPPSSGLADPRLERFDGHRWTALKTYASGCLDSDQAAAPHLGLFALVSDPVSGTGAIVAVLVSVLAAVVLALLAWRMSGRRVRRR